MAVVYYKFNSEKDFDSISLGDSPFISIAKLKEKIFQAKQLYRGKDCYLVVSNAQTNEEYLDEEMLIPKYISVLIRRVPGWLYGTIVREHQYYLKLKSQQKVENKVAETEPKTNGILAVNTSAMKFPVQSSNLMPEVPLINKSDEDNKIKALIDTPQLNCYKLGPIWMAGQHDFGLQQKTPPPGCVSQMPCAWYALKGQNLGHFIKHCPTNGDPDYDYERVKTFKNNALEAATHYRT